jgi:vacuolar-type H+-ATPase subunit H
MKHHADKALKSSVPTLALGALLMLGSGACIAEDPPPADADPTLIGDQARAAKETVKQNAKQVADAAREGAQQAATTARQVAKDVSSSAREGAQQVAETTRKGARKVKTTVSGDRPAAPPEADKPATP